MSLWSKLNQPIGKGAQAEAESTSDAKSQPNGKSRSRARSGAPAEAVAAAPPVSPTAFADDAPPPAANRKAGRKARSRKADAAGTDAPTAVLGGAGTATAVLDGLPPDNPAPTPIAPAPTAASRKASGSSSIAAVNLLSPWVLEELSVRRLRMRFLAGGVALLVLMAGVYGVLWMQLNHTREELRGDDAVAAGLDRQIKEMNDVRTYDADVSARGKDVSSTMSAEVSFSEVLADLQRALPKGALLTELTVTLPAEPLTTGPGAGDNPGEADTLICPGADPFGSRVVVACIELSGIAENRDEVSQIVQGLGSSDLFVEPFVSTTTTSDGEEVSGVEYSGTVGVSPKARSGRYNALDPSSDKSQQNESDEESR